MPPTLDSSQQQVVAQAMTTEQFTLQAARGSIATESTGRATMYLSTVSSALIAMGFVAQTLQFGRAFALLSVALMAVLFCLGVVTCIRLVQLSIDDMAYQRAINRLRHWYLEVAPAMRPYFMLSDRDDLLGVMRSATATRWQLVFAISGLITLVNSCLAAIAAGLLVGPIAGHDAPTSVLVGVACGVASLLLLAYAQSRFWHRAERELPVQFPSTSGDLPTHVGAR